MKLSPKQADLLDAMERGVRILYVGGRDSRWFRADTFRRCTSTVNALEKAGLVKIETHGFMHATLKLQKKESA